MSNKLKYLEKRRNVYFAVLYIPADLQRQFGKRRFHETTQTSDPVEAQARAYVKVAQWRAELKKAQGIPSKPEDAAWAADAAAYERAYEAGDFQTMTSLEDGMEAATLQMKDKDMARKVWKQVTQGAVPLAPLVTEWAGSLRLVEKTVNRMTADVEAMAAHFVTLDELKPKAVKAWTDKLAKDGTSSDTFARLGHGYRNFWRYLRESGTVDIDAADPFDLPMRLAVKTAPKTELNRQAFTPAEVSALYEAAGKGGDIPLARLIALGAYTGARIEELCKLTKANCTGGVFTIGDSKTEAGIRKVPIHPKLAAMVKTMCDEASDDYLVPSTAKGKLGIRSDPLSKRFGRLKTELKYGRAHVFHSIRKTVATQFEQAKPQAVPEGVAADVLGHEKQTMTYGLYSAGSSHEQKAEAVGRIAYPGALGAL